MGDNQLQSSFSVTLSLLNESDMKQDLPLSSPHQELTWTTSPSALITCVLLPSDAGVCVFKFSITRDTECCWVATRSFLITLGCLSIIMRSTTQSVSSQFYGCLSQQQNMLQDYLRTSTYQKAILLNDVDFKDKVCVYVLHRLVVLDVGCGTGILSFFAVQAGAKKAYAVEASSVAKYAEVHTILFMIHYSPSYRVLVFYHCPGMMFPTQGDIHLAPFTDEQLYMEHHARSNFW
ncbi:hypothetical protein cypCar_00016843 [Cyprinus carpio]|nr:hypothetical protein cypCar_00016843 [Cyprinus carpio]